MRESDRLLGWYDRNARDLPWRVPPGSDARPDPYRIWLSEVMLQQTTVAAVKDYFRKFTTTWRDIHALAAASDDDVMAAWAGLGYYARARNLLKCARVISRERDGTFPETVDGLQALPGIGPYTAAAIAAIAFGRRAVVVDGNVERVVSRLKAIETPLPASRPEIRMVADTLTPDTRPGDYAQAVMDLGATICTPRAPSCLICPLSEVCAARAGDLEETLPRKAAKAPKPDRRGFLYVARQGEDWLLERRPETGLLGGMLAFPVSDWSDEPASAEPFRAGWTEIGGVHHGFTHFNLSLTVLLADRAGNPDRGEWRPLDPDALPTLFRKAYDLVTQRLERGD